MEEYVLYIVEYGGEDYEAMTIDDEYGIDSAFEEYITTGKTTFDLDNEHYEDFTIFVQEIIYPSQELAENTQKMFIDIMEDAITYDQSKDKNYAFFVKKR